MSVVLKLFHVKDSWNYMYLTRGPHIFMTFSKIAEVQAHSTALGAASVLGDVYLVFS